MNNRFIQSLEKHIFSLVVAFNVLILQEFSWAENTLTIQKKEIRNFIPVVGILKSKNMPLVRARVAGTIEKISVTEGDYVKRGTLLAAIVDPTIESRIQSLETRIKSLENQKKLAQKQFIRSNQLRMQDLLSQADFEMSETNLAVLEQNMKGAQFEKKTLLAQKKMGEVIAPTNGTILTIPISSGMEVMPGETIMMMADDHRVLRIKVPESQERFLTVGGEIQVDIPLQHSDNPKKTVGKIQKIYPKIEAGYIFLDISLPTFDHASFDKEMIAYLPTDSYEGIVIPQDYVITQESLDFVRLKDLGEIMVQTGRPQEKGIEVLSGLNSGDVLVRP